MLKHVFKKLYRELKIFVNAVIVTKLISNVIYNCMIIIITLINGANGSHHHRIKQSGLKSRQGHSHSASLHSVV